MAKYRSALHTASHHVTQESFGGSEALPLSAVAFRPHEVILGHQYYSSQSLAVRCVCALIFAQ